MHRALLAADEKIVRCLQRQVESRPPQPVVLNIRCCPRVRRRNGFLLLSEDRPAVNGAANQATAGEGVTLPVPLQHQVGVKEGAHLLRVCQNHVPAAGLETERLSGVILAKTEGAAAAHRPATDPSGKIQQVQTVRLEGDGRLDAGAGEVNLGQGQLALGQVHPAGLGQQRIVSADAQLGQPRSAELERLPGEAETIEVERPEEQHIGGRFGALEGQTGRRR